MTVYLDAETIIDTMLGMNLWCRKQNNVKHVNINTVQ